jgi:glycosyltransferase involved in cell wall biosynthesis
MKLVAGTDGGAPVVDQCRLSVVIPAYNNDDPLDITLGSLTRQTMPADTFEVVVSDDGSTVPLGPVVDKYADRLNIVHVRADRNRGRPTSRNTGAARARSDVLLFMDADTVAHPDLLARHWAFHSKRPGRPGVLLGQRYETDWVGTDRLRRGEPLTPAMLDAYRADLREADYYLPQHKEDFTRAPWLLGFSHNVSVDKATFDAVGGFDEVMIKWGLEDVELFYRVFRYHGGPRDLFDLDLSAMSYHLPHYRRTGDLLGSLDNVRHVAGKHPHYDFEAMHSPANLGKVMGRARLYDDLIAACRREGLGRPAPLPAALTEELATHRTLVVGFGLTELSLGAGSHTFDHDAPPSETNWHLLGLMMQQFKTGQFEMLVNIDLWRFFMPEDLNMFVTKGLRKADRIDLVATHDGPDQESMLPLPFVVDFAYIADMMSKRFDMETRAYDAVTVITLR